MVGWRVLKQRADSGLGGYLPEEEGKKLYLQALEAAKFLGEAELKTAYDSLIKGLEEVVIVILDRALKGKSVDEAISLLKNDLDKNFGNEKEAFYLIRAANRGRYQAILGAKYEEKYYDLKNSKPEEAKLALADAIECYDRGTKKLSESEHQSYKQRAQELRVVLDGLGLEVEAGLLKLVKEQVQNAWVNGQGLEELVNKITGEIREKKYKNPEIITELRGFVAEIYLRLAESEECKYLGSTNGANSNKTHDLYQLALEYTDDTANKTLVQSKYEEFLQYMELKGYVVAAIQLMNTDKSNMDPSDKSELAKSQNTFLEQIERVLNSGLLGRLQKNVEACGELDFVRAGLYNDTAKFAGSEEDKIKRFEKSITLYNKAAAGGYSKEDVYKCIMMAYLELSVLHISYKDREADLDKAKESLREAHRFCSNATRTDDLCTLGIILGSSFKKLELLEEAKAVFESQLEKKPSAAVKKKLNQCISQVVVMINRVDDDDVPSAEVGKGPDKMPPISSVVGSGRLGGVASDPYGKKHLGIKVDFDIDFSALGGKMAANNAPEATGSVGKGKNKSMPGAYKPNNPR